MLCCYFPTYGLDFGINSVASCIFYYATFYYVINSVIEIDNIYFMKMDSCINTYLTKHDHHFAKLTQETNKINEQFWNKYGK